MVHMANCGPNTKGPMFFNVDKPVGNGGQTTDRSEDVQLVQMFLNLLGFYRPGEINLSGFNDPETVAAITQFQLNNTSPKPDGKISVAHGVTFGKNSPFAIVTLNNLVRDKTASSWPRIHRIPGRSAPPQLFNRVAALLAVS